MKKSLHVLSLGFIMLAANAIAQPTLTAAGINPAVGNTITSAFGGYVSPGSAGASQTWDLTSMTSGTPASGTYVAPSTSAYASSFPGANVASPGAPQAFYKTSSSAWQNEGFVSSANVVAHYSNSEDILRYPFTFNDTYMDTWATTFVSGGVTYYRTGTTTVTADSYGTLITHAGTFSNVLRVHFYQDYSDSADFMGSPFIIDYVNDEYMWYLNGNHAPIAAVFELTTGFGSPFQEGFYMTNVLGINENTVLISYDLYPNPASDYLNISINMKENQQVDIRLFNSLGAEVAQPIATEAQIGNNNYTVNVQELPAGVYYSQISLDGKAASSRMVTIAR